jgi:hypothetical protein
MECFFIRSLLCNYLAKLFCLAFGSSFFTLFYFSLLNFLFIFLFLVFSPWDGSHRDNLAESLSCQFTVVGFREPEVSRLLPNVGISKKNHTPRPDLKTWRKSVVYPMDFYSLWFSSLHFPYLVFSSLFFPLFFFLSVFPLFFPVAFVSLIALQKNLNLKIEKTQFFAISFSSFFQFFLSVLFQSCLIKKFNFKNSNNSVLCHLSHYDSLTLLWQGRDTARDAPPPPLPAHTLAVATETFRLLHHLVQQQLTLVQAVLGSEGISLEFRYLLVLV